MALTDKLTNIADAIRNKTNTTEPMTLDEMPTKIESIQTESTPNLQNKAITINENGTQTITADSGYDGLNEVEVTTNVAGSSGGGKYSPRYISFYNYSGTELDYELENLDTSRMTSMYYMFRGIGATSLDVSHFNTSNVTNMSYMFYTAQRVAKLDLSNWDASNVTNMGYMFSSCRAMETLILGESFNFNNVTNKTEMFKNTTSLKTLVIKSKTPLELTSDMNAFMGSNLPTDYFNGRVYVPDELVETYKTMAVWNTFSNPDVKFRPLSEYTG